MQNVLVTRKGEKGPVAARLFVIMARKSHTAVIFRRRQRVHVCMDGDQ